MMPCECGHSKIFHQEFCNRKTGYNTHHYCFDNCCCGKYREIDNLQYVEWKADRKLLKLATTILTGKWVLKYLWISFCDQSALQAMLFSLLITIVSYGVVVVPGMFRQDYRERVYKIAHLKVDCYTGEKLLYSGPVSEMPQMSNGSVRVKTATEEFVCTGYHEAIVNVK